MNRQYRTAIVLCLAFGSVVGCSGAQESTPQASQGEVGAATREGQQQPTGLSYGERRVSRVRELNNLGADLAAGANPSLGSEGSTEIINGTIPGVGDPLAARVVNLNMGGRGCSGTLLSNTWVLTAAHCLSVQEGGATGSLVTNTGATASVDYVFRNPQALALANPPVPGGMDVALAHITGWSPSAPNLTTSLSTVDPAPLTVLNCYGYGDNSATFNPPGGGGQNTLRTASIAVLSTQENGDTSHYTLQPNPSGQIQWLGDSGGPCFYNGSLIGVQSDDNWSGTTIKSAGQIKSVYVSNWVAHPGWSLAYSMSATNSWQVGGNIAAVSRNATVEDTYTIGNDGRVWDAGAWSSTTGFIAPYVMPTGQAANTWVPGGGIAAVSRVSTQVETYTVAPDGRVWNAGWWNGAWQPPYVVPNQHLNSFTPGGGVAAVSRTSSLLDTYSIGGDGRVWDAGWWNGSWNAYYLLPNQAVNSWVIGGGIAAVSRDQNTSETFTVAPDGRVWMSAGWNATAGWLTPYALNNAANSFTPGAPIAAVSRSSGVVDIYVVGKDGGVWNAGYTSGSGWAAPYEINLAGAWHTPSGIAATARGATNVDVYTIGNDGATWDAASWISLP